MLDLNRALVGPSPRAGVQHGDEGLVTFGVCHWEPLLSGLSYLLSLCQYQQQSGSLFSLSRVKSETMRSALWNRIFGQAKMHIRQEGELN
ncbi:hypothetical protein AAFF_G00322530 [Aldrovandia affinis]|uniref:Uncharacterized protein n=1 Tax=Aldrovandia affinis TaxID=143900 RepID=A0AAD7SNG7_9TELE|nr:hypothetical protein AAFF_G00322530 [Aldrovandia affinis]